MRKLTVVALCAGMFAGLSAGAEAPDQSEAFATGGNLSTLHTPAVTNEPFTATWTKEMVKTLPDGTTLTRHGHHLFARDSQGRIRIEQRLTDGKDGKPEIKMVTVTDPVAHTLTTWTEGAPGGKKMAFVTKLPERKPGEALCGCAVEDGSRPARVETKTDLGSQVLDNVAVRGELRTFVLPAGRVHNDKAITKTHELWSSAEMKLVLKQKWDDPRTGEEVVELKDLNRAEPAAALFHPPSGYVSKSSLENLKEMMAKMEAAQE